MDKSRLEIAEGMVLDARRAVFLRETGTLAVADLHLGYAWAHRHGGQLLPVSAQEDSLGRLLELVDDHAPRELVLLGDIVHRAVRVAELKAELCAVINGLSERLELVLVAGNHDRHLQAFLAECGLKKRVVLEHRAGAHLLVHGNAPAGPLPGGRIILGHEHPAITLSDGAATSAKVPCFAVTETVVMLPAFSRWAAGSDLRTYARSSRWLAGSGAVTAVAILGDKLLPVRLPVSGGARPI